MFQKNKINCEIYDVTEIDNFKNYGLVYNRYTDFYLEADKSKNLREIFNSKSLNLSPHPYEYFLLADKARLLDWNQQTHLEKPSSLLKIFDMGTSDKDQMWAQRKNLFFKPKNSFGSKQAYKGASMSHKAFDSVCSSDFIAQQLSIPSRITVALNAEEQKFKYDLRCYAYKNELQLIIARLYQGQTTNLNTPGGGFACVKVV